MKNSLQVGILALVIGAGISYFWDQNHNKKVSHFPTLLKREEIPTITQITLSKDKEKLTFTKNENDRWFISKDDNKNIPVKADRILNIFDNIVDAKFMREISHDKSSWEKLKLDKAEHIELYTKDKLLRSIILGDAGQHGGRYLALEGEDTSYLINEYITNSLEQSSWEMTQLFHIDSKELKAISFFPLNAPDQNATLSKDSATDPFKLKDLKEGEKQEEKNTSPLNYLFANLEYVTKSARESQEIASLFKEASKVVITTFSGTEFTILVTKQLVLASKVEKLDKDAKPEKDKVLYWLDIAINDTANQEKQTFWHDHLGKWYFSIAESAGAQFFKKRSDFVSAKEGS